MFVQITQDIANLDTRASHVDARCKMGQSLPIEFMQGCSPWRLPHQVVQHWSAIGNDWRRRRLTSLAFHQIAERESRITY